MSEEKSADLLSSNPQPDNVPTGNDTVGDGGVKQFLMQAWQNLAMYVAATEEPEGAAAGMMLLQGLRHLISGENLAEIMGGQPGQPGQPPVPPGQPQPPQHQMQMQQQQQQPQQDPRLQQQDPNAAPAGPADPQQPRQQSPFGTPAAQPTGVPGAPKPSAPKKSGSAPKKPAAKKSAPRPKPKPKAKTAMAAMDWLVEAASQDFGCATCDRTFGTESGLRSHLKNIHLPKEA